MAKNLISGPILAHLAQIRAGKCFFPKIWLRESLDIMVSYHPVQYQKKSAGFFCLVSWWKGYIYICIFNI